MGLMKRQKNDLFEQIEKSGLQHSEFNLSDNKNWNAYLEHPETKSFFSIRTFNGVTYDGSARIGDFGPYVYKDTRWDNLIEINFGDWLYDVKSQAESSDMWDELRRMEEIVTEAHGKEQENTQFSAEEQKQISAQLKAVKASLQSMQSLSSEQLAAIEARLDEAEEASRRINRKDWWLLFLGIMLPMVFTSLVPADVVQHTIITVFQGVGHLFSGNIPPGLPFEE